MSSNLNSHPGRTRLIGIALLVAIFLAGGFSGAALERRATSSSSSPEERPESSPAEGHDGHHRAPAKRNIFDELDLSATQRARIDSVLQAGREKVDAYWKETEPGYRALVDSTRAEVRSIMTPEQEAVYDSLRAARRAAQRAHSARAGRGNVPGEAGISNGSGTRAGSVADGIRRASERRME